MKSFDFNFVWDSEHIYSFFQFLSFFPPNFSVLPKLSLYPSLFLVLYWLSSSFSKLLNQLSVVLLLFSTIKDQENNLPPVFASLLFVVFILEGEPAWRYHLYLKLSFLENLVSIASGIQCCYIKIWGQLDFFSPYRSDLILSPVSSKDSLSFKPGNLTGICLIDHPRSFFISISLH